MKRRIFLTGLALSGLTACTGRTTAPIGPDGLPVQQVYLIGPNDADDIQFRMMDSVNSLRAAAGAGPVTLEPRLTAAAATHARDMSLQNRPWLFGSDGSSPLDRARRAGFPGRLLGENISETYETELETLAAWMQEEATRSVVLDRQARFMGFSWHQEPAGKLWWVMNMGSDPAQIAPISSSQPFTTPARTN